MRFFTEFSYHGAAYHGWQRQQNASTVQEALEKTFSLILRTPIQLTGAGRTDTGVHARQMFAHFNTDSSEVSQEDFIYKLNSFLPSDICVKKIFPVAREAHARFDAVYREYEYNLMLEKDPFWTDRAMFLGQPPDIQAMREAAQSLLLHKDFQSFSKTNTEVKTYLCEVKCADFETNSSLIIFRIGANRFLRNMVRAIMGTLLDVGYGKLHKRDFEKIIMARDRKLAGASVPAQGLFLVKIEYPPTIIRV